METDQVIAGLLRGGSVESAVSRIEFLGEKAYAADQIMELLDESTEDDQLRDLSQALSLLAVPDAEPALIKLAQSGDAVVRMNAAAGLGRIQSRAANVLQALLKDASMPVRREAAKAMGRIRVPKLGAVLVRAAQVEGEPEVRAALLVAVGQSGDKKQAKALEAFLKSSSESTRVAAARGLCGLGAPAGFAFAKKLLASTDKYERRQGLALFEGFPAKNIAPALKPLLDDPDVSISAAAARILFQGGDATMLGRLVVASHKANGDAKLKIENEIEPLHLSDADRQAILKRAGVK
jgi:HEAT repeat protein